MVIKITPKFTHSQIKALLQAKLNGINEAYFQQLSYVGEEFVKNARENGSYKDRTGNLRNSIGFVILKDGKQIISDFKRSATIKEIIIDKNGKTRKVTTKGSHDGVQSAKEKAIEISLKFPKGYVLICVAGMEYAAAVESKGLDVISSSSIIAKDSLIKAIEKLYKKFQKL